MLILGVAKLVRSVPDGADVRRAALTAVLALAAGLLAACGGSGPPANLISVSNGGCGSDWHVPGPGWYTFQIYNAAAEGGEVDLINPADGAIYAEVDGLGPGTSSPMRLDVGSGSYAFRCLFDDYDPMTGPTMHRRRPRQRHPRDPPCHQQ